MAWKNFIQPEQPAKAVAPTNLPIAERLQRAMAVSQIHAPKAANENPEIPKPANDNVFLGTSAEVKVIPVEDRLKMLRDALERVNVSAEEVGEVNKPTVENQGVVEDIVPQKTEEEVVTAITEQAQEPVLEAKQPEAEASFQQYSGLSGIDIDNLPKNVPEAKGIMSMSAKYEIQSVLKQEIGIWKVRKENIEWASQMLASREVDAWTKEYFGSLIAANENNVSKINTKAGSLVEEADDKIARLGEATEVDEAGIRAFTTLAKMRSERFIFPAYRGSDGKLFAESLANDNPAGALIIALQTATKKAA